MRITPIWVFNYVGDGDYILAIRARLDCFTRRAIFAILDNHGRESLASEPVNPLRFGQSGRGDLSLNRLGVPGVTQLRIWVSDHGIQRSPDQEQDDHKSEDRRWVAANLAQYTPGGLKSAVQCSLKGR